jgi:hypothetical protein
MRNPYTKITAAAPQGGAITAKERHLLPFGSLSWKQNLRDLHPGFVQRKGQRALHTVADGTNQVMSLYQFRKARVDEKHTFAQMSDGDVLAATTAPPGVTTGAFGAEVFSGSAGQLPASWGNIGDKLIMSNGIDQHQIYAGDSGYVDKFIVYQGAASIPDIPQLGKDYSDEVSDGQSDTVAVLDSLSTYANHDCIFFKTPINCKSITLTIPKPNGSASVASVYYYNGSWTAVSGLTDGTADTGATLATSGGTISWTMPTDILPKYAFGQNGFWWQIRFSAALDAEVEVSAVTFDADFQNIINLWNGVPEYAVEVQVEGETDSEWFTYAAGYVDLSELASGQKIMIAATDPLIGFYVDPGSLPNVNSVSVTAIKYWNGTQLTTVGTVNDGTNGLQNAGWMTFPRNAAQPHQWNTSQYYAYWYELTLSDALSEDVAISILCMPYFDINEFGKGLSNCIWKDRAILAFDRWSEYLYVSESGNPMVHNGSDFAILEAGDGRAHRCLCMRRFHNEMIVWQEEKGVEGGCTTLFEGYSPSTFGKLVLSSRIGIFNSKCAEVVEGVMTATATEEVLKTLCFWLSRYGGCVTDGRTVSVFTDDIGNYFDPAKSECVRRGYESEHWLAYDPAYNVLRLGLVSGSSATKPNVFPVFDLVDKTWSFDTPAQEISCMANIDAGSGNVAMVQIGGGTDDGIVYQLNYGSADVSTAIDAHFIMELSAQGEWIILYMLLLLMKAQTAGVVNLSFYENGVENSAFSQSVAATAEATGELTRRHLVPLNLKSTQLSIKVQSNDGNEFYLEGIGAQTDRWDGR